MLQYVACSVCHGAGVVFVSRHVLGTVAHTEWVQLPCAVCRGCGYFQAFIGSSYRSGGSGQISSDYPKQPPNDTTS